MNEEKLVAALRGQEPGGVQELVESYGDRLLRSAFLLCGNETDAEDIVQETFLQAMRSVHRFRCQSSIYTWLHSILLNLVRHYHRDRKRLVQDHDMAHGEGGESQEVTHNGLDIEIASSALMKALDQLSAPQREVVILRYYENMKIREMAELLGVSVGTVKSRLHYALEEMQRRFPSELNLFAAHGTKTMERT